MRQNFRNARRRCQRENVSDTPDNGKAVVEHAPEPARSSGLAFDELNYRIRQQELLAELGVLALQGKSLDELLPAAARVACDGLNAQFSKILRILPDQSGLLAVSGCGWGDDVIGRAVVGIDTDSPAGYALKTGKPVISNHLENEQRFSTPEILAKYGVRRAINVILQGAGAPFGVLEVDAQDPGEFSEHDLTFLQGTANVLGMAIERRRYEQQLRSALDHQQALLKEMNHRVKNSLQLVASTLRLQAASVDEERVRRLLGDAQARVRAIARAHERLYRSTEITYLDVGSYLCEVCADLNGGNIHCDGPGGIMIATDRAIPLALLVSELVTNSMKYAYPVQTSGPVWVRIAPVSDDRLQVSVADEGAGLPEGFDPETTGSLGIRLVKSFAQRLDADLEFCRRTPGTEVVLMMPRSEARASA